MTSGNSKYLIIFISIALVGTIAVQAILFSNAVEVRRARFKSEVNEALKNAGRRIEGIDAMNVMDSDSAFRPWLQSQIPEVFAVMDSGGSSDVMLEEDESQLMDSIGFYTFSYEADTTYYAPGGPFKVEVSQEGRGRRSRDGRISLYMGQMRRVEEKVLMMDTVLQTFVRSSVQDWVPITTRFTSDEIDSVISSELAIKGLDIPYEFAIAEGDYLSDLQSDSFDEFAEAYKVPIFRSDLWGSPRFLLLQVGDTDSYIYQSMWLMFSLSLLFLGGVIATFWTTLRQMIKQKKISNIKSDFINNMTHEFKTPIATINLAVDALNSPKLKDQPEKRSHYTDIIRKENQRMHQQVEHVLQMSMLDKDEVQLKRQEVSVYELVADAVAHLDLTVEKRGGILRLISDLDKSQDCISVDRHHFSNVLVNVLDNAVKYSPEAPEIEVILKKIDGKVQISVSDRGIGMTKEVREHIFDRFYRAETGNVHTVKGHGLGLAYAREIIERHLGRIEVFSSPGKGSTFVITLDLASGKS